LTIESPMLPPPRVSEILAHAWPDNLANGVGAFLWAVAGPGAIILAVATGAGLDQATISSWLLAAYGLGGALSIAASVLYRQPLAIGYSIPAVVLIGPALEKYAFAEIVGAYVATALLILLLATTGLIRRATAALPMPIVMAMVAGVFLPFGVRLVTAFGEALWISSAMVAAFLAASTVAALRRLFPPILAALIAGMIVAAAGGQLAPTLPIDVALARPVAHLPAFSWPALTELVIPLTVTVIAIHNPQGFAILRQAGYPPPERMITLLCGMATLVYGVLGCVPTVITGPVNAMLNASGPPAHRYVGAIWLGLLFLTFGIMAPTAVALALDIPQTMIGVMAGLAMIAVLQSAFTAAFAGRFATGAVVAFLVTVADVSIFNIGAAFWGLVFGLAISRIVEPGDFTDSHKR